MKILVVTVARSDFGIYEPLLKEFISRPGVDLEIVATGMHLAPEFGMTVHMIESAGYSVTHRVEMLLSSDTPEGVAKSMGLGIQGFAQLFATSRPDWLVVLGDRFEMFSAVAAALPFCIPIAHLHGGELTFGAIDDAMRHSITKMSHLHFVSTSEYARRVIQLGEAPWRVFHCGALALDGLDSINFLTPEELTVRFGVSFDSPPLLVTFHPETTRLGQSAAQMEELFAALLESEYSMVFTLPNADVAGRDIRARIEIFRQENSTRVTIVENFGRQGYFSMLRHAAAMVGNSSSGIIEAASFGLPVVNIGERQGGRAHGSNVLDVQPKRDAILAGIRRATTKEFRKACEGMINIYSAPNDSASKVIVDKILAQPIDENLLVKRFHDLSPHE